MARKSGLSKEDYTVMHLDLSSLESVRQFVDNFRYRHRHQPLCVFTQNAHTSSVTSIS